MLIDVITRVAEDSGYDLVQERDKLLKLANAAAREIYQELNVNSLRREASFTVGRNKLVSLPSQISTLIGMRQHTTEALVPLEQMTPRYNQDTLGYKWNNWRDVGESPLHTFPTAIDTLTFESAVVEDAVIQILGQTNVAAREGESLTLDESPKVTTKLYNPAGLKSISSMSTRNGNIIVKDIDGNEIATLFNNEKRTRYRIVDVSELFWGVDTSDGDTLVDVLYKEPLINLTLDADSFPGGDVYDDGWYYRCMSLFYKPMANRATDAARYRTESIVALMNIKDGTEHNQIQKVTFGRNKYMKRIYSADSYLNDATGANGELYQDY